ncbi:MAG TPA: uroporphyrinogen decarboxylase family protein [Thermotogota bacterium]|mgnify:CR=1 FL=1|nr:uroporphyrinogen decarboxylase family protein [Thermotogota bacterium]HRW92521.1 uroporphyrinogen decarboxylase family protein [Thermotogota bacterium]
MRQPDFESFAAVIQGKRKPSKVHLVELGVDIEVVKAVMEGVFSRHWSDDPQEQLLLRLEFERLLGYDAHVFSSHFSGMPEFEKKTSSDFGPLARANRTWALEGIGLINSQQDFHAVDWQAIRVDESPFLQVKQHLPKGMKILLFSTLFEQVMEWWMGYEGLFVNLVENPELVEDVFAQWGQKVFAFYQRFLSDPAVGGIFHADDMGFKTSTIVSPAVLEKYLFPWLKQFSRLAHDYGKLFLLHSCGNVSRIMPTLIQQIHIDGFHSFQDSICPIVDFYDQYPSIGALGGVDMDKLARYPPAELRAVVRAILQHCAPGGRFALGSGNTVANYVPIRNFQIMLQEAERFAL